MFHIHVMMSVRIQGVGVAIMSVKIPPGKHLCLISNRCLVRSLHESTIWLVSDAKRPPAFST